MVLAAFRAPEKAQTEQEELPERKSCDACGFKPYVVATKGKTVFMFCLHHGNQHVDKLRSEGYEIEDNSHVLTDKREQAKTTEAKAVNKMPGTPDDLMGV